MLGVLSDIDLRLVRVFLAIVDAGGVSMAQNTLNVGQSTISTQLATLETRLGFRLCERGRSGFGLTPKGERFVALARDLIGAVEEFGVQARNMDRKLVGTLRLGMAGHTPFSENSRISNAIARFRKRDAAVRIVISVCSPGSMEEQLMSGELDIGIGYFWHRNTSLHFTSLFLERQMAYCGQTHPLFARADSVSFQEAWENEWAWRSYPVPGGMVSTPPRNITAIADNMEAIAMLVLSGHHLAFLPQHFALNFQKQGLMAPLPAKHLSYEAVFSVATRQRKQIGEITKAFLEDLAAVHLATVHLAAGTRTD